MIGSISKKINACARAAGNEPILSWEMESGEKTKVRSWKLKVESQKSEVGGRNEICNLRNVRYNSQVRSWNSEVGRLSSAFAITNYAILVYLSFPYLQGFQVSFQNIKDSKLLHV